MDSYKPIIIVGGIAFVIIFFLIGMFFWPFVAYLTGMAVFVPSLILAIMSLLALIIVLGRVKPSKPFVYKSILIPLFVCNMLELAFCSARYKKETYSGNTIVITQLFGYREGLANPLGITILSPEYDFVYNNTFEGFAICRSDNDYGIYSIELEEMVVPMGQTLAKNGHEFSQGNYYGIATSDDIVVIPAVYDDIIIKSECIIVEKNGKYGALDIMGRHWVDCEYKDWNIKISAKDYTEYVIFKNDEGYNYVYNYNKKNWSYLFITEYDIYKIENDHCFIVQDSHYDYDYGMVNASGKTVVPVEYGYYIGYNSSDETYEFKEVTPYYNYYYYYNEAGERVNEKKYER